MGVEGLVEDILRPLLPVKVGEGILYPIAAAWTTVLEGRLIYRAALVVGVGKLSAMIGNWGE